MDECIHNISSNISAYAKHKGDFTRNRKLNAETTIKVTMNMQGNSLNAELLDAFPNINDRMTASAYEQAKAKLSPQVFEDIFHEYNATMIPKTLNVVNSYRVYAIDGSDFNPPYSEGSDFAVSYSIGRPKKDGTECKPFSQVHANMLYDLMNRTYQDAVLQPRTAIDERLAAVDMLNRLDHNTPFIAIMDRGYDGFNMIETLNRIENCYYIIRTKAGKCGIKEIQDLPDEECDKNMEFEITTSGTFYRAWRKEKPHLKYIHHSTRHYKEVRSDKTDDRRWDFEQHCFVKCRVVKFKINDPDSGKEVWEVLITNLNRFEFPVEKMMEMYHIRWDIETSFRELKYALGAVQFHSKKDDFIRMELFAHFTMFNAVSRNIACVKVPQQKENKHSYVVDFKMAVKVTRKYFRIYHDEPPDRIYAEILSYTVPIREGRQDKRNIKPKTAIWFVYRVA